MSNEELLNEFMYYFDYVDGSLPEIIISGFQDDQLFQSLEMIIKSSDGFSNNPTIWIEDEGKDIPLSEFKDFKRLFSAWANDPIHPVIANLEFEGIKIPDLQFCPLPDRQLLEILYRPGNDWTMPVLRAFLSLLKSMQTIAPSISIYIPQEGENIFAGTEKGEEFNNIVMDLLK